MAAGYAFGAIVMRDAVARRRLCLRIGLSATALYLAFVVAFVFFAPDQDAGGARPRLFAALSPPKYPASQPFLLMTLGPTIALLPFVERAKGRVADVLDDLRPRADVLLSAAHSGDPRRGARRDAPARGKPSSGMVCDSPVHIGARRASVAAAAALPGVRHRHRASVQAVPISTGVKARRQEAWLRYL